MLSKRTITTAIAAGVGVIALVAGSAAPAHAGPNTPNRDRYAALGDSIPAGVGSSVKGAYPALLAGKVNKVTIAASSGATTSSALAQVARIAPKAQQVTITVGANDVGWTGVAVACATGGQAACATALGAAAQAVNGVPMGVATLVGAVRAQAPGATVYVTGYPALFQPSRDPDTLSLTCAGLPGFDATQLAAFDQAIGGLNQAIAGGAAATGATYVDVTDEFAGHGLCSGPGSYINPPMPTATGYAEASLHPNAAGQAAYAEALAEAGVRTHQD